MPQSQLTPVNTSTQDIVVVPIPAFNDNYIWAIGRDTQADIILVDPGDAQVCINYIESYEKQLVAILVTHHHADHIGGIAKLKAYCAQKSWPLTIYGPELDPVPCDVKVNQTHRVNISSLGLTFSILDIPGHTHGHIAYLSSNHLFCGDTLFSGGCGRIFEGTPAQMFTSLNKLKELPETTLVYCAHEYTLANLNFALAVEPSNKALINYQNKILLLRENNQISLPSSIKQEKLINPFLRGEQSEIKQNVAENFALTLESSLETFTYLRRWKDNF